MTSALHARWRAAFKFLSTHSSHGFAMGSGVSSLKWHRLAATRNAEVALELRRG